MREVGRERERRQRFVEKVIRLPTSPPRVLSNLIFRTRICGWILWERLYGGGTEKSARVIRYFHVLMKC